MQSNAGAVPALEESAALASFLASDQSPTLRYAACDAGAAAADAGLADQARSLLRQHGREAVLGELTQPYSSQPPQLLPYLAATLLDAAGLSLPFRPASSSSCPPPPAHPRPPAPLRVPTGVAALDRLCGGGGVPVDPGSIVELAGPAGAGKTQLALQLALHAAAADVNAAAIAPGATAGRSHAAIYVCTEGVPPIGRLLALDAALAARLGVAPNSLAARVLIEHPNCADGGGGGSGGASSGGGGGGGDTGGGGKGSSSGSLSDADALVRWAETRLPFVRRRSGARLVLLDSVAAVYRVEFGEHRARAAHLRRLAAALRAADVATVAVNQVSQAVDRASGELDAVVPALGAAWAACVDTRLFVRRVRSGGGATRVARVLSSSVVRCHGGDGAEEGEQQMDEAYYTITAEGVVDV